MDVQSEILDSKPPADNDAERFVIGSILLDPSKRELVRFLKPEDFHAPQHARLFEAIMEMEAVDEALLASKLRMTGLLEDVGGMAYILEILRETPVAAHAVHYAKVVRELAQKRRFIWLSWEALKATYSGRWTVSELAGRLIERLKQFTD